jgi:N-acetylneuraminic acid mutarotase
MHSSLSIVIFSKVSISKSYLYWLVSCQVCRACISKFLHSHLIVVFCDCNAPSCPVFSLLRNNDVCLTGAEDVDQKHAAERRLNRLIGGRSSVNELVRRNILPEDGLERGPQVQQIQKNLLKEQDKARLSRFLESRPTLEDVVNHNLMQDTMTWTRDIQKGSLPTPRNCHTTTAVGSQIFLLGGYGPGVRSIELCVYDTDTSTWSRPLGTGVVPAARYSHSCVAVASQLILFGGFSLQHNRWLNDVHVLDTEFQQPFVTPLGRGRRHSQDSKVATANEIMSPKNLNTPQTVLMWYQPKIVGEVPCQRAAHSATVIGNLIYIFGGNDGSSFFNDLHILDTDMLEWRKVDTTGDIPPPRAGHTASVLSKNAIVVFGGGNEQGPTNDLHVLDTTTMCWTRRKVYGTAPSARAGHIASTVFDTQLLVFGGGYIDKVCNDVHMYDFDMNTWARPSDTGTIPVPRAGHTVALVGPRLYVFGGGDADDVFNDMHVLDTAFFRLPRGRSMENGKLQRVPSRDRHGSISGAELHNMPARQAHLVTRKIAGATSRIKHALAETQRKIAEKHAEQQFKEQQLFGMLKMIEDSRENQFALLRDEIKRVEDHVLGELDGLVATFEQLQRSSSGEAQAVSDSGHPEQQPQCDVRKHDTAAGPVRSVRPIQPVTRARNYAMVVPLSSSTPATTREPVAPSTTAQQLKVEPGADSKSSRRALRKAKQRAKRKKKPSNEQ